jgi:hypothetical protein
MGIPDRSAGQGAQLLCRPSELLTLIENDQCCSSKVTTLACSG